MEKGCAVRPRAGGIPWISWQDLTRPMPVPARGGLPRHVAAAAGMAISSQLPATASLAIIGTVCETWLAGGSNVQTVSVLRRHRGRSGPVPAVRRQPRQSQPSTGALVGDRHGGVPPARRGHGPAWVESPVMARASPLSSRRPRGGWPALRGSAAGRRSGDGRRQRPPAPHAMEGAWMRGPGIHDPGPNAITSAYAAGRPLCPSRR